MLARCIGLIANHGKPNAGEFAQQIVSACVYRGLNLKLETHTARLVGNGPGFTSSELAERCDLLLVLGGDGTILQVVHELGDHLCPIFGINLGTLGFLTSVGASAWAEALDAVVAKNYRLSERTLLEIKVRRGEQILARQLALNDAVISRGEASCLIRLDVRVDQEALSHYHADGLIIATPTGSTAYNLSAGGPVMTPNSGVFVITPICPHVLTLRPVLVSDSALIEIAPALDQPNVFLTCDGQTALQILAGDIIEITKAPQPLPLAMLPEMSFFDVLRAKLKWSGTAV